MKKIFAFVLLFVSANVSAQNNAVEDTADTPSITAVGKPDGNKTEMKISKDGGKFISSDGKVELKIPEGATSKKTTFSIQPITNMAPNGNGKAYRLEPSGIQFQKPVQLIFHYDDDEAKESMQSLMGIAMQDDKGQWHSLKKFTLDTVAKTIAGNISHFSDWSKFDEIKIDPASARLKVKKNMSLTINLVSADDDGDELIQLSPLKKKKIPWKATWMANEIINGNATEGKIAITSRTSIEYTAPATLPPKNPVAVTADLTGIAYRTKINGKVTTFEKLRLVSNILIYDNAYEVKMISSYDSFAGTLVGSITYKDTGSFVVSLTRTEARLIEKVNKNASASLNYSGGECTVTFLKSGEGNIHVMGKPAIKVTPASEPGKSATIEINFSRFPVLLPLLQFACPKVTSTNAQANAIAAGMIPAFPQQIKFEAKEGEQTILELGQPGGQLYVKFTVKQLKED